MSEHTLAAEFPEHKDNIHKLKISDNHFKRLFDSYEEIVKELHRYAEGAGAITDERAENLKKERLRLKDELRKLLSSIN